MINLKKSFEDELIYSGQLIGVMIIYLGNYR